MPRSVAILLLILKNWSVHFDQNHQKPFHHEITPPPLCQTHLSEQYKIFQQAETLFLFDLFQNQASPLILKL